MVRSTDENRLDLREYYRQDGTTYALLQQIPLWLGIVEETALQIDTDLAQEIVASKHVRVPDGQPQSFRLQAGKGRMEAQRLIKDGIQCVLLDFGLAFASLRLIG